MADARSSALRAVAQNPAVLLGNPALSGAEQYGDIMKPATASTTKKLAAGLRAAVDAMGGPLSARMAQHGQQQAARFQSGDASPTPMTGETMDLADSVAGNLVGNIGMAAALRAYHGSPHRFSKFSMDKIGTGEGGKMLGHGLHFSSQKGVARRYGNNVYDVMLDDSRILDVRKNIEELPQATRSALESAGVINQPVTTSNEGGRVIFKVGDKPVWQVEEVAPGQFKHYLGTGQQARPKDGKTIEEIENAVRRDYPTTGPVSQILENGQVSERLAERLRAAGIGGIVDTDLSAKSASGSVAGKPRDVFLVFDDSLVDITHVDGKPVMPAERAEVLGQHQDGLPMDQASPKKRKKPDAAD